MGQTHIAGTWRTTASVADVWAVIEDLGTWPRWWPAIRDVAPEDGASRARFTFDTPARLPALRVELTIVERDPPTRLLARATDGPLSGDATLELMRTDDVTEIGYDVTMRVRSLLFRPLESAIGGASRSGGKDRLRQAGDDLAALAGGDPLEHDV